MEDGAKRHLFQLQPKKDETLLLLPNPILKDTIEYMENTIRGTPSPRYLCLCCPSRPHKLADPIFQTAFAQLPLPSQITYYRNFLDSALAVAKHKTHSQINNHSNLQETRQTLLVYYRIPSHKKWKPTELTLDSSSKILQTPLSRIDLHETFLLRLKTQNPQNDYQELHSWTDSRKNIQIRLPQSNEDFFQRLNWLIQQATEENIARILTTQKTLLEDPPEHTSTERSLKAQKQYQDKTIPHTLRYSIKEVQIVNYLTYQHPVTPLPKSDKDQRLVPSGQLHYFLEGDWEIESDGQLIAINEKKLSAQGSVVKYILKRMFTGSKVSQISLPVTVFNTQSNLSLLITSYASAPLELQPAALQSSPLQRFLRVIRFALLTPCSYIRCDKPFNPILGQTCQTTVNGTLLYGEQISHHPPISALFIKGRGFTLYGSFEAQVNFGPNSAQGNNKGQIKISFDPHNLAQKVVRLNNIPGKMTGMLIGKRRLNLIGKIYIIDQENLLYIELKYGEVTQPNTKQYNDSVEGHILQLKKGTNLNLEHPEPISPQHIQNNYGIISGRWLSEVYFNGALLIDTRKEYPPQMERYPALLPSDYSLRKDIILKRQALDDDLCQTAKEELEQIQRKDRKLRQKYQKT